jgi:hypothetical protein
VEETCLQIAEQNLIIDGCSKMAWLKEVDRVEVGNVNAALIRLLAVGTVFLNIKAKEADFRRYSRVWILENFEGKDRLGSVGEAIGEAFGAISAKRAFENYLHFKTALTSSSSEV